MTAKYLVVLDEMAEQFLVVECVTQQNRTIAVCHYKEDAELIIAALTSSKARRAGVVQPIHDSIQKH